MELNFETADGVKVVRNWGYQLQSSKGKTGRGKTKPLSASELAAQPHDLIVIDSQKDGTIKNAFTRAEVEHLRQRAGSQSVVVSYISVGEASDYRDHWQDNWTTYTDADQRAAGEPTADAPAWLGAWNENWPNSRKVRYWDPGWQAIIFNDKKTGWLDAIIAAGFDGAYLDIIDGYYHWGCEIAKTADCREGDPKTEREAASRMIDFVVALSKHARKTNPHFIVIPQNGAYIIDALEDEDHKRRDAYLEAINAIACEDLFFKGDKVENNPYAPDEDAIDALVRDFLEQGIVVLSVDYLSDKKKIAKFYDVATEKGFLPYAAPKRELNIMGQPYDGSGEKVA
ncbi:MAG: endo alpha-1,4 polygalactosaminidase [Hyphomicrobium sp.]